MSYLIIRLVVSCHFKCGVLIIISYLYLLYFVIICCFVALFLFLNKILILIYSFILIMMFFICLNFIFIVPWPKSKFWPKNYKAHLRLVWPIFGAQFLIHFSSSKSTRKKKAGWNVKYPLAPENIITVAASSPHENSHHSHPTFVSITSQTPIILDMILQISPRAVPSQGHH